MIGGGGGGGGAGANDGADENSNNANDSGYRASSGGSGGGGGLLTIITQSGLQANSPTYNITFSGTGDGGAYQGNSGYRGYTGSAGTNVAFGLYSGNDNTPIFNLSVNGGEGGQAGVGTDTNNNDVYGGVGGNYNSSNNVTVLGTIGATGYGGGNSFVGYAGIVTNLGENYNAPTLNTNIDYSSNSNQPAQTNGVEINNTNDVPGYGQGGVGGWNSNNNNGYPGQNGGSALVRVYYMA